MEKVSVVIPVYNGWELVKRNIDSLLKYEKNNISEIIVVNDCSPEANPYNFDSELITIIRNIKNLGYTGTVNNGLRRASSEIILLLDSDAFLFCSIIDRLKMIYSSDKNIGCIGFAARDEAGNPSGSFQYSSTVLGLVIGQKLEADLSGLLQSRDKLVLPLSCCVSFRKQCLEEVDYFDEETFPVLEADTDLGMRIHNSTWKLLYDKDIIVIHEGGNSYKVNSKRVRMYHSAKWKLFKKHSMIKNIKIVRSLLLSRIGAEIFALRLLKHLKSNEETLDKLEGRKLLFKEVQQY